ncbi:PVC-type heme-binding CxxCH protein [Ulvibacterium marinum]|uniref:Dehydrogenase n=1 Tax=Ulvibacterium marinum TaxID=2419782 RepID=A0A3B0BTY8_9FLAO|nr:PVC-type heme-binding CxxCH protein [Ulvibacterium marinum]RKN76775.1 dehydrogenase [Ulvibacterium marinum]
MDIKKLLWVPIIVFVFGTHSSCQNKKPSIDFDNLSESEKRKSENAMSSMKVAEGLQLELFASEPMVTNPTNLAIDARGRIWLCEGRNYRLFANPDNTYDDKGDRILILEDTDGDGAADTSKVFYQGEDVNSALGIAVLGNKVIVSKSPNVLVFTDEDGDDKPDSKEILFTGMEGEDHDHGVHAFVFGPDGRLYFNFGNNGKQLLDKNGNPLKDIYGNTIDNSGSPYREGMAFRCELDGSNIEVLGHNFRNPYEVTVDSYGGLWQSDNDDDGNRGTRINYLMEYGNYGFKDLLTGENWRERRTGWHDEVPKRHWHLNDPGSVPNMLQTGSGSPCGILVYEDTLLPEKYHHQLIHAEPGHNVVRSYIVEEKGAGYSAKIHELVKSEDDWFRPDDVAVAPDGSLFISDWYDGGVGGHKAEDIAQGRVYHLSVKDGYEPPKFDFKTAKGAKAALLSDNMDVFYQGWQKLHSMQEEAEPILGELIAQGGIAKARALWLGAQINSKTGDYVELALADTDSKYRVQGIRMARYLLKNKLETYLSQMVNDASMQVRREVTIALRHLGTPKAAELWAELAKKYQGGDRWYLEALGIGSDVYPNLYFNAWKSAIRADWKNLAGHEIVWRTRADASVPMLSEMIQDKEVSKEILPSYFRAFAFKEHPQKNHLILDLLRTEHPLNNQISALAIGQLDEDFVNSSRKNIGIVKSVLPKIEGTAEWLMAVKNLGLKDQNEPLLRLVSNTEADGDLRKEAAGVLFGYGGKELVMSHLKSGIEESKKMELLGIIGNINDSSAITMLVESLDEEEFDGPLKKRVVEGLGNTWDGRHRLYEMLQNDDLAEEYKTTAVLKLMNSWDAEIRANAPKYLTGSETAEWNIETLIEQKGDALAGKEVYDTYCSSCHRAGTTGIEFGPALTDIGNKLSKQSLYSSIIYPSAGINFGYEGYTVKMKDGKTYVGYILSQTEDELALKMMGGTQTTIQLTNIEKLEAMNQSLMTQGLHKVMSQGDLINLVEYLTTLKVEEEIVASN